MIECDDMNNNKGQALVEFIIILPIVLLLIISIIDFGNIMLKSYSLENDLDIVTDMYMENDLDNINNYVLDKNINISYDKKDKFLTINLSKNIKISSIVISLMLGNNYDVKASRTIYINE